MVQSSEIEGIHLNTADVRSSIARRLGIESIEQTGNTSHYIDGVVNVMLDAMEHYDMVLTKEKLCAWQSAFFPTGYSSGAKIEVGAYRTHEEMVVSGYLGRERVHYIAPAPERVEQEMAHFLDWFNNDIPVSSIVRSAIAHLWFVSIHPFEDGNGRLARILGDMFLAKGQRSPYRFYNISSVINRKKSHYYKVMERTQHGDGDITEWIVWYINALIAAIDDANVKLSAVLKKSIFWINAAGILLNKRQISTLNLFLDGYEAKLTSKSWAALNKCSKDTAIRDIKDLAAKGLLREDIPNAKRPSYSIVYNNDASNKPLKTADLKIAKEGEYFFIKGTLNSSTIHERILDLDAERHLRGDLPLEHIAEKYLSFILYGA